MQLCIAGAEMTRRNKKSVARVDYPIVPGHRQTGANGLIRRWATWSEGQAEYVEGWEKGGRARKTRPRRGWQLVDGRSNEMAEGTE